MKALVVAALLASSLPAQDGTERVVREYAAAQSAIESAIAKADFVSVETVESSSSRKLLWKSDIAHEVRALSASFRIKPPRFKKSIVDGKERIEVIEASCFCYGQFWVTFKRRDEQLLSLLVFHGHRVASDALGAFEVHEADLDAFYSRMVNLTKKSANKAPEPTPGAVTPRATEGPSK